MEFSHFPLLTTDRCALREIKASDINEIFKLRSDPVQNQYLDRPIARSLDDAREFIHYINNGSNYNIRIYWAITSKNKDNLIGTICLWNISKESNRAEIGFELLPEYQGKGIMQESIKCILNYGFETMKLLLISAFVHPENSKSINLLKKFHFAPDPDKTIVESMELRYILNNTRL